MRIYIRVYTLWVFTVRLSFMRLRIPNQLGHNFFFQTGEDFMSQSSGFKVFDNCFSMLAPYEVKSINQLEMQIFFELGRLQIV